MMGLEKLHETSVTHSEPLQVSGVLLPINQLKELSLVVALYRCGLQRQNAIQHTHAIRPSSNDVTDEQCAITGRERHSIEEFVELIETAVNVSDDQSSCHLVPLLRRVDAAHRASSRQCLNVVQK